MNSVCGGFVLGVCLALCNGCSLASPVRQMLPVQAREFAPSQSSILLGFQNSSQIQLRGRGPFFSIPQNTWNYSEIASNQVNDVTVYEGVIYAATDSGLCISRDRGETFVTVTTAQGLGDNVANSVSVDSQAIYVATMGGLSVSTDGGNQFRNYTEEDGLGDRSVNSIVLAEDGTLFVATGAGLSIKRPGESYFLNRTTDDGLVSSWINEIFIEGQRVYVATPEGVSVSEDYGVSFSEFGNHEDFVDWRVNTVAVHRTGVYVGTDTGLAAVRPGRSRFVRVSIPVLPPHPPIQVIKIVGGLIYVGTSEGLYRSSNGRSFEQIELGEREWIQSIFVSDDAVYLGTRRSSLLRSFDQMQTFERTPHQKGLPGKRIQKTVLAPEGLFAATEAGLAISENHGESFYSRHFSDGLASDFVNSVYVFFDSVFCASSFGFATSGDRGGHFYTIPQMDGYASVVNGEGSTVYLGTQNGMFVSREGAEFHAISPESGLAGGSIRSIHTRSGVVYVAMSEHVYVSGNQGLSFNEVNIPVSSNPYEFRVVWANENRVLIGSNQGLLVSSGPGQGFVLRTDANGLASNEVYSVVEFMGRIYVGTLEGLSISEDGGDHFRSLKVTQADDVGDNLINDISLGNGGLYLSTDQGLLFYRY